MAIYPCSRCDQPFQGEAQNVYLTLFRGDTKASARFIICGNCCLDLVDEWLTRALWRTPDGQWARPDADEGLDALFWPQEGAQQRFGRQNGPVAHWQQPRAWRAS
jgi:hypothetical protein